MLSVIIQNVNILSVVAPILYLAGI